MSVLNKHALVLNADYQPLSYQPLSTWNFEDTIKAVIKDTVTVVAEYDDDVHSPSMTMKMPSVIALKQYVQVKQRIPFTRNNIYLRDRFRCQYCGNKFKAEDLTFDHVIPREKGGQTTWNNIVSACFPCNNKKDNRLMKPLMEPRKPNISDILAAQQEFEPRYLHESWLSYLYWTTELEK
jgi:5-methylcytosine-specific restriction endonuclease McrA